MSENVMQTLYLVCAIWGFSTCTLACFSWAAVFATDRVGIAAKVAFAVLCAAACGTGLAMGFGSTAMMVLEGCKQVTCW